MKNIIESIRKQYPVSDLTIKELEFYLTPCSFPKRYQLIKEGIYCKYAYFIEKGILRAYWVVDGRNTLLRSEQRDVLFSAWMNYITTKKAKNMWKRWRKWKPTESI